MVMMTDEGEEKPENRANGLLRMGGGCIFWMLRLKELDPIVFVCLNVSVGQAALPGDGVIVKFAFTSFTVFY